MAGANSESAHSCDRRLLGDCENGQWERRNNAWDGVWACGSLPISTEQINVVNRALRGRSSRTFIEQKSTGSSSDEPQKGRFREIEFGT